MIPTSKTTLDQNRAPIYEALEQFRERRVVPFDVPGHKRGRGNPELTAFLGEQCVSIDVNSMKPLDNLCHPISVIREAEELAADAFGAAHAFLMVGGTTSAVQSMVLTACKRGDEIILPRNVHRSVINALVLCRRPQTSQELWLGRALYGMALVLCTLLSYSAFGLYKSWKIVLLAGAVMVGLYALWGIPLFILADRREKRNLNAMNERFKDNFEA